MSDPFLRHVGAGRVSHLCIIQCSHHRCHNARYRIQVGLRARWDNLPLLACIASLGGLPCESAGYVEGKGPEVRTPKTPLPPRAGEVEGLRRFCANSCAHPSPNPRLSRLGPFKSWLIGISSSNPTRASTRTSLTHRPFLLTAMDISGVKGSVPFSTSQLKMPPADDG